MFFLVSRVYRKQPLCLGGKYCFSGISENCKKGMLAIMTVTKSMKGTPYWMAPEAILQTSHSLSIEGVRLYIILPFIRMEACFCESNP
ncbi:hypothetical protein KY289_027356 [Solanum tuberosum]|nr:hypothetical protein KY289_027356 [Solanum tuberosum]